MPLPKSSPPTGAWLRDTPLNVKTQKPLTPQRFIACMKCSIQVPLRATSRKSSGSPKEQHFPLFLALLSRQSVWYPTAGGYLLLLLHLLQIDERNDRRWRLLGALDEHTPVLWNRHGAIESWRLGAGLDM